MCMSLFMLYYRMITLCVTSCDGVVVWNKSVMFLLLLFLGFVCRSKHCAFGYIVALVCYSVFEHYVFLMASFKHCASIVAPWRLRLGPLSIALLCYRALALRLGPLSIALLCYRALALRLVALSIALFMLSRLGVNVETLSIVLFMLSRPGVKVETF
ncbi:hypothetical protein P8452_52510 [Trifolium repens]|nr:hypothetical protein P8452_52510 [Trifolium repens]